MDSRSDNEVEGLVNVLADISIASMIKKLISIAVSSKRLLKQVRASGPDYPFLILKPAAAIPREVPSPRRLDGPEAPWSCLYYLCSGGLTPSTTYIHPGLIRHLLYCMIILDYEFHPKRRLSFPKLL